MTGLRPADRERVGFGERFATGDAAALDRAVAFLRAVGARHVRVAVDPAEPHWAATVFDALAGFELLVAVPRAEPVVFDALVARLPPGCAVEVTSRCPEATCAALRAAGHPVVGPEDGVASVVHALDPGGRADWAMPAAEGRPAWLVTGYSTWRHDPGAQIAAFRSAVRSGAARVYWHGIEDQSGAGAARDPRLACFGLLRAGGAPKLLGRLLAEGGLDAVDRTAELALPAPAVVGTRPVLVTGGAGFIGSNLADRLAAEGHDVLVLDALARPGVDRNLAWLRRRHPRRITVALADLRDAEAVREATARADAVFHLAAQVAVTTSLGDPRSDFDINALGTLNVIEGLRRRSAPRPAPLIFASTNKVYGDLADVDVSDQGGAWLPTDGALRAHGIGEARPLQFHTPYGCSKGASDQYVLDAAHSHGIPAVVLRMSCIYGPRQMGSEDQGWLAHFLISVLDGKPITLFGDGKQVRDALYVDDCVDAYLGAWRAAGRVSGQAFNLGGGPDNAVTLRGVIAEIERLTGRRAALDWADWRPGDQRYFVADSRRARAAFGLPAPVGWRDGLARLARWLGEQREPVTERELVAAP